MKIYIGADHRGFKLKTEVFAHLAKEGYAVEDMGNKVYDAEDDFPVFAGNVARAVIGDDDSRGILICGGGQGVCMAANRFRGIRAVKIDNTMDAVLSRKDNDANVLCLSANDMENNPELWQSIIEFWLKADHPKVERFERRNQMLDNLTN